MYQTKNSQPHYKQIIDWILDELQSGSLKAGDRLPPEKEIANRFRVSRGTARAALQGLKKNRVLDSVQGSGYYIAKTQNTMDITYRTTLLNKIDSLLDELLAAGFFENEILSYFHFALSQKIASLNRPKVILVECNPDVLPIYSSQFRGRLNFDLDFFIITEETTSVDLQILDDADLIITTPEHFSQMVKLRSTLVEKLFRYNVGISNNTLTAISELPINANIGLLCQSERFYKLVQTAIKNFNKTSRLNVCYNPENLDSFLEGLDYLFIPFGSPLCNSSKVNNIINNFINHGKQIISFDYQIERGSLAYIEEQIANLIGTDLSNS